ncbi:recombinase family protein [Paenibacillus pasadenensis]|uniref:recombinase family protein n=1 Tax=Paenibacillus pasadenensis TaxID=217090 RepID=UPI0015E11DA3|nr:recombinase family protein [Paenibacillus pasadenensis]
MGIELTSLAGLYLRVSTDKQADGYSLDAQKAALLDYCRKAQIEVYNIYVDAGVSGKSIESRPALLELLKDAKNGCFGQVLCLRLNRISRRLADLLHIVELLAQQNVKLHSLTEDLHTDTPAGKFFFQMIGAVAENERRQISQNVRLGMQRRNRLGKWNGGNQVLGYCWIPDLDDQHQTAQIVPEEADLVRSIFEWYASGLGLKAIANRLNTNSYRTKRGKTFYSVSVRSLLTNVNYIGKITYRDDKGVRRVTDGEHDPIVSLDLWERVQDRLAEQSHPPTKLISRHSPLTGLLKCPSCGSGMVPAHVTRKRKNGTNKVNHYYVCSRYNSGGSAACLPNHIPADTAETWVNEQVQQFLSHPSVSERLVKEINSRNEKKMQPVRQRVREIETQLASYRGRSQRCFEMFEDGHIDALELRKRLDDVRAESALLEEEREQLEQELAKHSERSVPVTSIQQALANFRPLMQNASPEQQKKLFRGLIEKIIVPQDRNIMNTVIQTKAALQNLEFPTLQTEGAKKA